MCPFVSADFPLKEEGINKKRRTIMNEKILSRLMTCLILCLSTYASSCSKDDSDDELEQTTNVSSQDPEGTIVLNMSSGASGNYRPVRLEIIMPAVKLY